MASHSQRPQGERLVIGITGRIGSGKTTVGRYLESKHGFQYLRYSEILAEWRAKDPESKSHLQKVGWEVMVGEMQGELNRRLVARITPDADASVDGLRHPLDYQTLSSFFYKSFHLLFINSPALLRFERLNQKGKYEDFASFNAAEHHPVEQHIDSLLAKAAVVVDNQGSLQDLYNTVDATISSLRKEGQS
jgi:dephospho-CoA kinase